MTLDIQIVYAALMGAAYAGTWFLLKVLDKTKPETWRDFDAPSFLITMVFGIAIAIGDAMAGLTFSESQFVIQLLAYGTQIATAREIVLVLYRWLESMISGQKRVT